MIGSLYVCDGIDPSCKNSSQIITKWVSVDHDLDIMGKQNDQKAKHHRLPQQKKTYQS